MKNTATLVLLATTLVACDQTNQKKETTLEYPETQKVDTVDTYFGNEVPDPYRWLEDDMSKETEQWVNAQNKLTFGYLGQIPYRDNIKNQLEELWNYERVSAPFNEGD